MGFTQNLEAFVSLELIWKQKDSLLSIAAQSLAPHHGTYGHKHQFLYRSVTVYEKCFFMKILNKENGVKVL